MAVIPAAGRGTRMRPASRVVPKALITVVDRPAIQYAVEEAARAGAKEAILVVDLDVGHLVAQHFHVEGPLPSLEDVRVRPVVQEEPLGLGHAVHEAAEMVGDRSFFCLLSDNIVRPGRDVLPQMAEGSGDGAVSVMCLREYSDEYLDKYGFVIPRSEVEDSYLDLGGAVEKTRQGERSFPTGSGGPATYSPLRSSRSWPKPPPGSVARSSSPTRSTSWAGRAACGAMWPMRTS